MAKKGKHTQRDALWAEAKKRCRLSERHIEMAKRLGLNPKKIPKYSPNNSEPWKGPLPEFIERIYWKRFGKFEKAASKRPEPKRPAPDPAGQRPLSPPMPADELVESDEGDAFEASMF